MQTSQIDDILDEVRNGRPFYLLESREDAEVIHLVLAAQFVTPISVTNYDQLGATGLRLAITGARGAQLGVGGNGIAIDPERERLALRVTAHSGPRASALDCARAIAAAVNPSGTSEDLARAPHVQTICVRDGGVLVRPAPAEAAVDIMRLAGIMPAAAIWTLAGGEESAPSGGTDAIDGPIALKAATVNELIGYRRKRERLVECVASGPFDSFYASDFTIRVYRDLIDGAEHIALIRGDINTGADTLVRIHQLDLTADLLHFQDAQPDYVPEALRALGACQGAAVGIFLQDSDPHSASAMIDAGRQAYADSRNERDYGIAAQILKDIGVTRMALLTSSKRKMDAMAGFGLDIADHIPMAREAS